ncbi:leucine-rich repeat receptor-like protein kinase TDR [Aristolochia californica]|uniref:leucine-rich repeat receptor-like protein kinase TDR n=1 Tax=Aristolochia californica TaxID=171875 RepID=UPI0035DEAF66
MEVQAVTRSIIAFMFLIQVRILAADRYSDALLGLKSETLDPSNSLSDWIAGSGQSSGFRIEACSWSGITCTRNSSKLIRLDLSRKNLFGTLSGKYIGALADLVDLNLSHNSFSGRLPMEIFNLTNLKILDISRNNFSDPFPEGIAAVQQLTVLDAFSNSFSGPLPLEIARLDSLKVLNLAGSYFEGPIPREYGAFKSLEFLHLAGNSLSHQIPKELGNLQTVEHMEIGYNYYRGRIPPELGNMSNLRYLDIAQANLSGPVPDLLSNLSRLESLFLFKNQLTGPVPPSFGNIKSLVNLDLSDNLLTGPIPTSFANLKNIRLLSLMYNYMNGTVPEGIAELPLLDTLLIWNNFFSGSLPQNLGKNSQLKWVDVSTNNFTGSVPPRICAGGKLSKLMLFSNHFADGLSSALSNCSSLVRLRVEDNSFADSFPLKFKLLSDIKYVDMSRNKFTGGIPGEISQAVNLQYFNVSNNPNLGGSIPTGIWSLPLLQNFSASSCNISGYLPQFGSCNSISVIELEKNHLSGAIPEHVANCRDLERLDFAHNALTGSIPSELANLPRLSILDLSHNKLTGPMPPRFGNSSRLALLNVSFNNISGSIPSEQIFITMGPSAYIGNPLLCGAPLQPCLVIVPQEAGYRVGNRSSGKLAWALGLCSGLVLILILGALFLHKRSQVQWKLVPFSGLPLFKAKDILRSLSYCKSTETEAPSSKLLCKTVLPTGITVAVRKIEWEEKQREVILEYINQIGNARHRNLIRLLGFCGNNCGGYLLYDYLPNGNLTEKMRVKGGSSLGNWAAKYKVINGIVRGLSYLHHDCNPPIPHGDLTANNIMFDETMEAHLAEFGMKYLSQMNGGVLPRTFVISDTGETDTGLEKEMSRDIYSFGELLLEVLTNGRLKNSGELLQSKPQEAILREMYNENAGGCTDAEKKEIKIVLQVALMCTRSSPSDRPSMEDVLKQLSGLQSNRKH